MMDAAKCVKHVILVIFTTFRTSWNDNSLVIKAAVVFNRTGIVIVHGFLLVYNEHAGYLDFLIIVSLLQQLIICQLNFSSTLILCLPRESHQVGEHATRMAQENMLSICLWSGHWITCHLRFFHLVLANVCIFREQANI